MNFNIIGGGLSGLYAAYTLSALFPTRKITIYEGRDRLGGRILTTKHGADLGGTWHWKNDITFKKIVKDLDLNTIKDRAVGDGKRIVGGVYSIIEALKTRIDPLGNVDIVMCHKLVKIHADNSLEFENGVIVDSSDSVTFLAIPPRLLIDKVMFVPELDMEFVFLCKNTPTWMAQQGKISLHFPDLHNPKTNIPSSFISQDLDKPMSAIFEVSTDSDIGRTFWGFIAQEVDRDEDSLKVEGLNQIKQILSIRDDEKVIVDVMDWSKEYAFTCTDGDLAELTPYIHSDYKGVERFQSEVRKDIWMIGSETSSRETGFLEGAVRSVQERISRVFMIENLY